MKTNWKQIINDAPEQDMQQVLIRLARQAVAVHLNEQARQGGKLQQSDELTPFANNRIKEIFQNRGASS